jgi:hypothetical protein
MQESLMSYLEGVVYDPPSSGYPPLVVIFRADGEILTARAAASVEAAESFLAEVLAEVQAKLDSELAKKDHLTER